MQIGDRQFFKGVIRYFNFLIIIIMYAVPFRALNLIDRVIVDSPFAVFHVPHHVRSVLAVTMRDKIEQNGQISLDQFSQV